MGVGGWGWGGEGEGRGRKGKGGEKEKGGGEKMREIWRRMFEDMVAVMGRNEGTGSERVKESIRRGK